MDNINMLIYCCTCKKHISARLTNGIEIYPHRPDLHDLPFWKCDICNNFIGCHHKTKNRTKPLGNIANRELKNARVDIHKILDPLFLDKKISRKKLYYNISKQLGYEYHTAKIKDIKEARTVYKIILNIKKGLQ